MRILILTQYFDPEPNFKGLSFAKELVRQGHEVEVLTGFPNYPGGKIYPGYHLRLLQREVMDGVQITRVPLFPSHDSWALGRMLNYLSFAFAAALLGPWVVRRADVVFADHGNATIGLPAWALRFFRGMPFVLVIDDLWPDSILSSGMLPASLNALIPAISAWCGFIYRKAIKIAVLSKGFRETLISRGVPESKVEVIYNWCNEVQAQAGALNPSEERLLMGRFNIVMAGNMGKMQGLDVVLEAAVQIQGLGLGVQFVMVGGGVERPRLEEQAATMGLGQVLLFLPRRPVEEIGALLHRADALLVHLKDDPLFAITIPSRIQAYLAVGRPILCGVRGNGAELIHEAKAGLCFEPENADSLVDAVLNLYHLPQAERLAMGERGRRFYRDRMSLQVGTKAFLDLFTRVLAK